MLRSFLLAPCLLICLACATPFPIENLEEGMTAETVRETFGEPKGGVLSSSWWTYVDEKRMWPFILIPPFMLTIPVFTAIPDTPWDHIYVNRRPILLYFKAEELVYWDVGEFEWTPATAQETQELFRDPFKDAAHHTKGHTHHHGHGC